MSRVDLTGLWGVFFLVCKWLGPIAVFTTPGSLDHPAWDDCDCGSGLLLPQTD